MTVTILRTFLLLICTVGLVRGQQQDQPILDNREREQTPGQQMDAALKEAFDKARALRAATNAPPTVVRPGSPNVSTDSAPTTPRPTPGASTRPSSTISPPPTVVRPGSPNVSTGSAPPTPRPTPGASTPPSSTISPPPTAATEAPTGGALKPEDTVLPPGTINFPGADIEQVFDIYAELVGRTILRPSNLPATTITLKTQTELTREEAVQALDAVLALNQISMIDVGDKFVKAVPMAQAGQEGAPVSTNKANELPEMGQYVTQIVALKHVKAEEVMPALQPFAKIPNAVLPIESSNMLVLRDFTENVKRMMEMIERIDVEVESEFTNEVIPIKFALASEIANALNSLSSGGETTSVGGGQSGGISGGSGGSRFGGSSSSFGSRGYGGSSYGGSSRYGGSYGGYRPQQAATTPARGSSSSSFTQRLRNIVSRASQEDEFQILGETRIIADERTNSLLIFANKRDMAMIKDIVEKLDVVLAQVLIEALVIEVSLDDNFQWGISYLQDAKDFGNNVTGSGGVFNNASLIDPGTIQGATNLLGGFSYFANYNDDFYVAATAAASDNKVRVLQRPRVQTSHAVQARLFVGETRPYPTGSYYGGVGFGGYSSIQQLNIGVTLTVLPLINPDGLVVMDIEQQVESFGGNVTIANVGEVPVTRRRDANAKVAVHSGDTIVLGGFISSDQSNSRSGVPILKDIPGLGWLFSARSETKARRELMIFIRPTVLETPKVAAEVAMEEKHKMPGVMAAEREFTKEHNARMEKERKEAMKDAELLEKDSAPQGTAFDEQ